jgi:hypothetical protein
MKRYAIALCLIQMILLGLPPAMAADVERSDVIRKVYRFGEAAGDRLVIVDNVFGSIEVEGYEGDEVRMTAHKTVFAKSNKHVEEAEEEVTLDIIEQDDCIEFYVDGPFREKRRGGVRWEGYRRQGYKVVYDFKLLIPRDCSVELKTVNEGDISVTEIEGDFDVANVNGEIKMKGLRGAGEATTVNGDVRLEFDRNPTGNCDFSTINGNVKLYFQKDLSADFYMKTMNGEAFTDFVVTSLPGRTTTSHTHKGHNVYKVNRMSGIRAGVGGPNIDIHTLNGDMFILCR